jgi:ArsR family transcriptional regulator, lead/cadmium/zinc/bismuth-responsive transcriptional repressor
MVSDNSLICSVVCFNEKKIHALQKQMSTIDELRGPAERYKAMGHPARLAILNILNVEECCVCDLANILEQPISTVSQHLRILRLVGLVKSRQDGKLIFYSLNEDVHLFQDWTLKASHA